jgi:mannosyl-glycoprotein endo-beta-N-acetylglucosaminidase
MPISWTHPTSVCIGLIIAVVTVSRLSQSKYQSYLENLMFCLYFLPRIPKTRLSFYGPIIRNSIEPRAPRDNPSFSGTLSWEVASTFPAVNTRITSPEDPIPAWNCQPTIPWFPSFLYFNIYAQPFSDQYNVGKVDEAIWIGTSGAGWSGKHKALLFFRKICRLRFRQHKVRFYVQGVSDCGEVMKWHRCAFVDVSLL